MNRVDLGCSERTRLSSLNSRKHTVASLPDRSLFAAALPTRSPRWPIPYPLPQASGLATPFALGGDHPHFQRELHTIHHELVRGRPRTCKGTSFANDDRAPPWNDGLLRHSVSTLSALDV
jgi:hypothetical protein